jgi:hypothetical protein
VRGFRVSVRDGVGVGVRVRIRIRVSGVRVVFVMPPVLLGLKIRCLTSDATLSSLTFIPNS